MYLYIYIYVYIYVYKYVYKYIYTYTYIYIYININTYEGLWGTHAEGALEVERASEMIGWSPPIRAVVPAMHF